MIIVNASHKIITEQDYLKKIELIARVCYKSEDQIKEGSDVKMVKALLDKQHTAMLEHSSVCFRIDKDSYFKLKKMIDLIQTSKSAIQNVTDIHRNYLRFSDFENEKYLVSGNFRAWVQTFENFRKFGLSIPKGISTILKKVSKDTIDFSDYSFWDEEDYCLFSNYDSLSLQERLLHEDLSVMFIVDRGVTHEMVRMREASFAQESTRYCNYSKGKYGNEITVVKPCFWEEDSEPYKVWKESCEHAEYSYLKLTNMESVIAQQARDVLPTSTKAEITMTANLGEWRHILALRACDSTGPAHPQIKEVMIPLLNELKANSYYAGLFDDLIPKSL